MLNRSLRLVLAGGALFALAGCATTDEWNTWWAHPTHFASGSHLGFSVKNREGTSAHVTRANIAMAREQAWWGKAVSVSQDRILER